jgi:8-oxo-dGTP pyrophosphatase MutT (NUDIX family)
MGDNLVRKQTDTSYIKTTASAVIPYNDGVKEGFVYVYTSKDDEWGLPGGKIELFEEINCALSREVKEETGLDILLEVNSLLGIWDFKSERGSCVNNKVFYTKVIGGKLIEKKPNEIEKINIFTLGEIREFYQQGKIRAGRANLEPVEEYLRGIRYPLNLIHTLF